MWQTKKKNGHQRNAHRTFKDMILLKICAKRTQDIADLEQIYSTFRNEIDHDYVECWAGKLNIKLNRTSQYHLPELRDRQIFADIHR